MFNTPPVIYKIYNLRCEFIKKHSQFPNILNITGSDYDDLITYCCRSLENRQCPKNLVYMGMKVRISDILSIAHEIELTEEEIKN